MLTFKGLALLCRPKQWIKNGFVFGPLIFSGLFFSWESWLLAITTAVFFCFAASAVYIVNDIKDVESDRLHPKKSKTRPLANGSLQLRQAISLLIALYCALGLCAFWRLDVFFVLLLYVLINLAYTGGLKKVPVVDIFIVASGFVLRVYAGTVALELEPSYWMLITTLCLALYLSAVKRRQELVLAGDRSRDVLRTYNVALIDRYAEMSSTGALIFYSLFVLTVRPELAVTIPFVLFGLFRYWYVVELDQAGESPTDVVWQDGILALCILLWISVVVLVLAGVWESA